jgi:hypothetical protein
MRRLPFVIYPVAIKQERPDKVRPIETKTTLELMRENCTLAVFAGRI